MAAKKSGTKRTTVPLQITGMVSSGDPALTATRVQRNVLPAAGPVWSKRPPFVSDLSLVNVAVSFLNWEDTATRLNRIVAGYYNGGIGSRLQVKDTGAETWGAAIVTANYGEVFHISDFANFRGRAYYTVTIRSDGSQRNVVAFDGANAAANIHAFGLRPLTVTSYIDRIFMGGGTIAFTSGLDQTDAYDLTNWTLTTVDWFRVTNGTTTTVRIAPTNATTSVARTPKYGVDSSAQTLGAVRYLAALRGVSATYAMPITQRLLVDNPWLASHLYPALTIVTPTTSNGFCYQSQNAAATTAAGEPAWPTTISTTVVDGGVTWTCIGSEVIGSTEYSVPTASESAEFIQRELIGNLPKTHGPTSVVGEIKFGNSSTPSVTTQIPVEFSFRDGLADGTAGKKNRGHQLTATSFGYPFFNQESSATASADNSDTIFWSEPGQPEVVLNQGFYRLRDSAGKITAACVTGGRYVAFKRTSASPFVPNEADPDNPIIREKIYANGIIGSRAIVVFDDTVYGIGEDYIWSWRLGGDFVDICGDEMRDEIMNKSAATWVEAQSTYNTPLLAMDRARKILYAYTQKGKIYGYRLDSKAWFRYDVNDSGFEVNDMLWSPATGKLYVSWGGQQVSRLDHTVTNQADAVNNSGTTYTIVTQTDLPVEFRGPQYDVILDRVNAYIKATADQTGQVFYVYVSTDQGATFTLYNEITLPVGSGQYERIPIDLYQCYPSFVIRLQHEGNGGGVNYTLSSAEAEINVMAGAFPRTLPSGVGSNLT